MKKRISFFLVLALLLTMIPQFAFAANSDTVATQLQGVYSKLTDTEKATLAQAKTQIISLASSNDSVWNTIFDQISPVLTISDGNKTLIKDFIADAASIAFSASSTDLAGDIQDLKTEHLNTFKAVFGNAEGQEVLNQLVDLIMSIIANPQNTINSYISNPDVVVLLGTSTNQGYIDKMESIATKAAVGIINTSDYSYLKDQLARSDIQWSISGIVDAVYTLIQTADTDNLDASNALVNAAIRSKADLTGSTSLTVGNTATYTIGLFGQETNAVKFALSDSSKGTFTGNVLTANAAGTPDLRVYRAGVDPVAEPLNYIYSYPITITSHNTGGGGGGSSTTTDTGSNTTDTTKEVSLGSSNVTANVTQVNGQNVATVTVNTQAITNLIQQNGAGITVAIPVTATADVVKAELPGTLIQTMQASQVIVKVETAAASYAIPSNDIIEAIKAEFGTDTALANVSVNIQIAEPPAAQVKIVQDTAAKNNFQVVVPPVEFDVSCTYNGKTVDVNKFNSYVERTIPIPDGVDPSKITIGIVLNNDVNNDGTFSHVPTSIVNINGKYYAKINSLTNSVYSVIYSNKAFADVSNHWAKADVNDMASRLIINGVNDTTFELDKDITRAEFMAIVVRGLGLLRTGQGNASFADVKASDWYYDTVYIAKEYGITNGKNGNFDPNSKITREEAMTMIARAMKITGIDTNITAQDVNTQLSAFTDNAKVSDWAKASAAVCVKNNVIGGYNKMISAQNKITRAETAAIVKRMLVKAKLINQ